ncbi:hypothetical protein [Haloprofundus halobius]|uniref:hypothetical protein n=1 Tax=Haloprofundus halobius TaxID=2876194 RepID=UPI001CC9E1AD|nr:hypothetical protein [Haloprofundus halobius]
MSVWKFAAVTLLLIVAAPVLGLSYDNAAKPYTATNETHTLTDSWRSVDEADRAASFSDEIVVVYNETTLDEGSDYRWNDSTGEFRRVNGSSAPDGATVDITYDYTARSDSTKGVNSILSAGATAFPYLLLMFMAVAVLNLMELI